MASHGSMGCKEDKEDEQAYCQDIIIYFYNSTGKFDCTMKVFAELKCRAYAMMTSMY